MGANGSEETVMVAVHGAWSSAWAWKKMRPRLAARGVTLVTPSHTGLGERAHLARPEVDLETHIADVANVFEYEDLRDVVLVAHSYGGMVATGVLWRMPERIRSIVYLDAMVPEPGQCVLDLLAPDAAKALVEHVDTSGEGWKVPPNPLPADTSAADVAWITPRRELPRSPNRSRSKGPLPAWPVPTFIASAAALAMCSVRSPIEPVSAPTGHWKKSTPATVPTSTAPDLLTEVLLRAC